MDAKSVTRHFDRAYKGGNVYVEYLGDETWLATDGYAMYRLTEQLACEVFADPGKWPNLPRTTGHGFRLYPGGHAATTATGNLTRLWRDFTETTESRDCVLTPLHILDDDGSLFRVAMPYALNTTTQVADVWESGTAVNTKFLDVLKSKVFDLEAYTYRQSGPDRALVVSWVGTPRAVIMPLTRDAVSMLLISTVLPRVA